jgi:hypothetical protein
MAYFVSDRGGFELSKSRLSENRFEDGANPGVVPKSRYARSCRRIFKEQTFRMRIYAFRDADA